MKLFYLSIFLLFFALLASPLEAKQIEAYFSPNGGFSSWNNSRAIKLPTGKQVKPTMNNAVLDLGQFANLAHPHALASENAVHDRKHHRRAQVDDGVALQRRHVNHGHRGRPGNRQDEFIVGQLVNGNEVDPHHGPQERW